MGTWLSQRRTLVRQVVLLLGVLVLVLAAELHGRSQSPTATSVEDGESAAPRANSQESVDLYAEAFEAVEEDYVDQQKIDSVEQTYGAIKGMIDSLGDEGHTRFLTPEEVEETHDTVSSKHVGTGVRLEDRGGEVVVLSSLSGSSVEGVGIKPGDIVIAVDGESVQGENIIEVSEKLEGPEESRVGLIVLRDGEEREVSIERAKLEVSAASWNLIRGTDTALLKLTSFSENSAAELKGALAEAQEAGAQRFVLDLRDNEGGRVKQAEEIASRFLPAGSEIYTRKDADGEEEKTVPGNNEPLDVPLVVLVNGRSASAAEIVAGALRDNERAKLVGRTTFGAGTVLDERELRDGSAILLAVAQWLTPNGDFIRGSGIEPDIEAKLEKGQESRAPDEVRGLTGEEIFAVDAQIWRAFEVLQKE